MSDDAHLLRQYVETRSEAAFAELVQRHLALVYHSAARQLGDDSHLAEDVAQSVFVLLGGKSRSLLAHPSLAGWLHATTHFKVSELLRTERRRRTREAAAHYMHDATLTEIGEREWEQLRPLIDDVLLELKESDREAVLLRFFEERPFAEIAGRLGLTEKSAHKRVERALNNLRECLGRRGVKSTTAALGAVLSSHAAFAAPPVGLATSVMGAVMASGLPAAATLSIISFMSTKTVATATAIALVVVSGIATQQVDAEREATASLAALERENAALAARLRADEARRMQETTARQSTANAAQVIAPTPTSAVARALGSGGLASVEESRAFLRANPEVRDALADYTHHTLAAEYAELLPVLGLTEADRDRFLSILASGMRRIVGEHQLSLAETEISGTDMTLQLRELLGEARYQRYREFRSNAVSRDMANEVMRSLYFTATPLTAAQSIELKNIVSRAVADPTLGPKYTGSVWPYIPMPVWDRILKDARATLVEPQLEALGELQVRSQFFHAQTAASKAYRAAQAARKQPEK